MHKLYTIIASTSLLFLGCGESTNDIKKTDKIIIVHEMGITGCIALDKFGKKDLRKTGKITNINYSSKSNKVSCSTYGKTRGYLESYSDISPDIAMECTEFIFSDIQEAFPNKDLGFYKNKNKACVLSFDLK